MMVLFASSALDKKDLTARARELDALVLDPSAAGSVEELELSFYLAKKSFSNGKALAKKMKYEFLLWLTGKTDIRSTMEKSAPRSTKQIMIVMFSGEKRIVLDTLMAKERKKALKKNADPVRLEEISLSRIKN